MKQMAKFALIFTVVTLAACGKVGPLQPKAGQAPPAKAIGQTEVPSADALMTASEQSRPGRSDELMRRSERRVDDPFDLPPGSDPVGGQKTETEPAQTTATQPK
jgi:predicted small lipoprotein YifL